MIACMLAIPFISVLVTFASHEFEHAFIVTGRIAAAERGVRTAMDEVLARTASVASDQALSDAVVRDDASTVGRRLEDALRTSGLTAIAATDASGMTVARAPDQRSGDFLFQTTPWGRAAASGKAEVMIDADPEFPLAMFGSAPLVRDDAVVGAIFGGHVLDSAYAKTFRNAVLSPREHVAFYSVRSGITGTSFDDPEDARRLGLLFHEGSDAVLEDGPDRVAGHFRIGKTIYHIGNIAFTDASGRKVGGVFVLTPAHTDVPPAAAGIFGILLVILLYRHLRKEHRARRLLLVLSVFGPLAVAGVVLYSVKAIQGFLYDVTVPSQTIYNSTMAFSPETQIYGVGAPQTVDVLITTGGEEINAARAVIAYDPTVMRVEEIETDRSFCDPRFILEKTIDRVHGQVTISCVTTKAVSGGRTLLAGLVIQPLKSGSAQLHFSDGTAVYANDGLGTDVLRTAVDGSYRFASASAGGPIELFSPSHPNPSRWYSDRDVRMDWTTPDRQAAYAYAVDEDPGSVPTGDRTTTDTDAVVTVAHDGVYWFHLAPRDHLTRDATAHARIQVDTTPPEKPELQVSQTTVHVGDTVRFRLLAHGDNLSGLQKNFYLRFNGGIWLPTSSEVSVPFLQAGTVKVELRVFDNAGNHSDAETRIRVE